MRTLIAPHTACVLVMTATVLQRSIVASKSEIAAGWAPRPHESETPRRAAAVGSDEPLRSVAASRHATPEEAEGSMDSEQRASANRRLTSSAFTTTGSCSASGSCVSSGNYPSSYANYESCTITANSAGVLSVTSFTTSTASMRL